MGMPFSFFVILLPILSVQANENQQAETNPVNANYDDFYEIKDGDQILDDRIKQLEDEEQIAICKIDKTRSEQNAPVCPSSSISASLALSLLRHSSSSSKSFVLSPFSLGSALAVLHDGANGRTQRELTDLLLPGCTLDDVTNHYSSLTQSLPSTDRDISFTIANQLFVNESFSLTESFAKHIKRQYKTKIEKLNLREKEKSANQINEFVQNATNGKIENIIDPNAISDEAEAIQINAISFRGTWETEFHTSFTNNSGTFHGALGEREISFMRQEHKYFAINQDINFGTALIMPYKDKEFKFFALLPNESQSFEQMRREITGEKLIDILSKAEKVSTTLTIPKIKIESELNGINVLSKIGVSTMFTDKADFSKITDTPIWISNVEHKATIEVNEAGTEASAVTGMLWERQCRSCSLIISFDRPFLYGITRNDDILFLGQFV